MTKDTVVAFRAPEGFSPDPLTDLLRQGARDLIAQAVEAELNAFLTAHADQTDAAGRRRLVRHGHLPEREVQTGIGAVSVQVPRVRDRSPEGGRLKFTSTILPPYLRRAKSIEELLPWLYLKGEYPSCARAFWHPESVGLDQRIGGFEKFAHKSDDGDFCWFPSVAELSVFGLQFGIETHGHERRHVERVA